MADLTSTIRITGTVGGRLISFLHAATVANVYDVGFRQGQGSAASSAYKAVNGASDGDGGYPTFPQACPDYFLFRNDGLSGTVELNVDLDGGSTSLRMFVTPGMPVVIMSPEIGGLANESATATTATLLDAEIFTPAALHTGIPASSMLFAYNTAS